MKIAALFTAIAIAACGLAFAQPPSQDKQKAEVYSIQTDYRMKIDKLRQQIKDLQTEEQTKMRRVLNAEQEAILAKGLVDEKKEEPKKDEKKPEKPPCPGFPDLQLRLQIGGTSGFFLKEG